MRKLSDKMLAFCEEYVYNSTKGYNAIDAYSKAYANDNRDVCRVESWKMMRDPRIIDQIKKLEGTYKLISLESKVDKKFIIDNLKLMMEAVNSKGEPDYTARNNAINTWAKLTGEFEAEKKMITVEDVSEVTKDPSKMTDDEIKEEKEKLLKEL